MAQSSPPYVSLEKFPVGQRVSLPGHFLEPVTLEGIRFIGSGYECRVRLADGTPDEAILSLEEGAVLAGQSAVTPTAIQPAEAEKLRLLVESARIRLAYAHDRQFAVSLSGIRTLPHQIEAVYMKMLPQPRLRFLLADDPGAGKTHHGGPSAQRDETSRSNRAHPYPLPGTANHPVAGRVATVVRRTIRGHFLRR